MRWVVFCGLMKNDNLWYMLNWNVYVFNSFLTISKRGKKTFYFVFIDVCPLNLPFSKTAVSGLWAYLAPLCYTLSVPLQLSSELCRKIFLHVLAELCRFSASCSHSADIPLDCPPADTHTENFIYPNRTIMFLQSTATYTIIQHIQKDVLGSSVHGMGRKKCTSAFCVVQC